MTMTAKLQMLRLDLLDESPTNPRKTFDAAKLKDLAAHIEAEGVLDAIRCRPRPAGRYEIVIGHRRTRASRLAGLEDIPAVVREMSDREVVELQLVELAKREDVHPLEEAEGYAVLRDDHKLDDKEIAAKVGATVIHVKERLKLCSLTKDARKAYLEGPMLHGVAVMLARLGPDAQAEALKELKDEHDREHWDDTKDQPLALRAAQRVIEQHFLLDLKSAPFDTTDVDLVPAAGSCAKCPKRTGNQVELFADVKSKDTCTDRLCFGQKRDASAAAKVATAQARGHKVLTGKEAFSALAGSSGYSRDTYLDLKGKTWTGNKEKTYAQLLKAEGVELEVVLAQSGTELRELVIRKEAAEVLGGKASELGRGGGGSESATQKAARKKAEIANETARRAITQVLAAAELKLDFVAGLRAIAIGLINGLGNDDGKAMLRRREVTLGKSQWDNRAPLRSDLRKMTEDRDIYALALEAAITPGASPGYNGTGFGEALKEACALYGVSLDKVKGEVQAEKAAKKKGKPADGKKTAPRAKAARAAKFPTLEDLVVDDGPCCSNCECTEAFACEGGCSWVKGATIRGEPADVCSSCVEVTDQAKAKKGKKSKAAEVSP